jgi:hypothetical protein
VSSLLQLALIPADNQDGRSPSPPYRARSQLDSPAPSVAPSSSVAGGRGLYNPNISGLSLTSPVRGDTTSQPVAAFSDKSTLLPATTTTSSAGGGAGSGRSGESSPPSRKDPNITSLYSRASVALRSHRKAAEFDVSMIVSILIIHLNDSSFASIHFIDCARFVQVPIADLHVF